MRKKEPAHYHYDIRFIFIVKKKEIKISDESKEAKWVTIEQARQLMTTSDKTRLLDKAYEIYREMNHSTD